ncbi:unnamed protein product, partial [Brenthis ino]
MASVLRVLRVFGMAPIKLIPLRPAHSRLTPLNGYHVSVSRSLRIYSYIFVTVYMIADFMRVVHLENYGYLGQMKGLRTVVWIMIYFAKGLFYPIIISLGTLKGYSRMKNLVEYVNTLEKMRYVDFADRTVPSDLQAVSDDACFSQSPVMYIN